MTGASTLARWRSPLLMPRLTRPDAWLLAAAAALLGLGIVMVFNVSYFRADSLYGDPYVFFRKHLVAVGVGGLVVVVVSRIRPDMLEAWASLLLAVSVVALALVMLPGLGTERGGAQRWVCLGGFCVQPSEFVKISVVLYLARCISRRRDQMREFTAGVLPLLCAVGLCALLMVLQPDLGGAAILGAVLLAMLYVGGARVTHLAGVGLLSAVLLGLAIWAAPYRVARLLAFWDPWPHCRDIAFQLCQSLIAFGSGGIGGVGLGQSRQKMFFLPEAHTDFIFSVVGEELGLLGVVAVLGLFALIAVRGLRVAARHPDLFSSLLAFGLTLVIVLSAVVNAGVVLGVLPTKGLALPFLSYGGSALTGTLFQIGVLAALSRMTG